MLAEGASLTLAQWQVTRSLAGSAHLAAEMGAASHARRGHIGSAARHLLGEHGTRGVAENEEVARGDSYCLLESGRCPRGYLNELRGTLGLRVQ